MRFSLRAKIIFFIAFVVLLSHLALFAYGLTELRHQDLEEVKGRMSALAHHQATLIDQRLATLSTTFDDVVQTQLSGAEPLAGSAAELAAALSKLPTAELAALVDPNQPNRSALAAREQNRILTRDLTRTERQRWQSLEPGWTISRDDSGRFDLQLIRRIQKSGASLIFVLRSRTDDLIHSPDELASLNARLVVVDKTDQVLPLGSAPWSDTARTPTGQAWTQNADPGTSTGPTWQFPADLPITGLRLSLQVDERPTTEAFVQGARRLALTLGTSVLFVLSVVWFGAKSLTRRIQTLDLAADEVARGNYMAAPRTHSHDELGRLASSIAGMAQQLRVRDQELRLVRGDLERRVSERTAELGESHNRLELQISETRETEEALRQARDEAELASKAKSEFLSNMSHELRTPLNGVLGYAQILRRDQLMTDRQRENLDAIESCGQHLLTLINDVLDISKIEAGRMNVDIGPTDLHKLIKEVYDIVMQRAQSKGLALRVELDPTLPRVIRTDGTKLRQILLNLLGNAVKFTQEGWVVLRAHDDEDGRMRVEVEDTGIGIPDDKVDMIFDPFKQAEAGMVIGGSGLGLAINQRLIELLGGEPIEVDTALDRGSRFSFRLPLEAVSEDQLPENEEVLYEDEANVRLAPGQEVAVLVVDDRRENRDILRRLLSDAGFTIEEADNGRVALDMMQNAKFDLILMDIRMPGMSGMEAIREIRANPETRDHKVVAVTASVFPEFREQIKAAGFDEFLGKPFRSGELFHKIRELLQLRYVGLQQEEQHAAKKQLQVESEGTEAGWPIALARAAIKRIRSAVELGDITALADLADKLRIDGRAPSRDIDTIARLGRSFDFDGLTEFARQLERNHQ